MITTLLLDRDGTLNQESANPFSPGKTGSPYHVEDFCLLDGVREAVDIVRSKGIDICVISNQPYVSRGILALEVLDGINGVLERELGIPKNRVYYCTHGDEDGCTCRKPSPGLLYRASQEHRFFLADSIMIGDRWRDVVAGKWAGCAMSVFLGHFRGEQWAKCDEYRAMPDLVCANLLDAVNNLFMVGGK